jgi:hypothetical protein
MQKYSCPTIPSFERKLHHAGCFYRSRNIEKPFSNSGTEIAVAKLMQSYIRNLYLFGRNGGQ